MSLYCLLLCRTTSLQKNANANILIMIINKYTALFKQKTLLLCHLSSDDDAESA
ncbi:hypothetical protein COPEUT_00251 [Coprococcus eutactus ATCC 27759]|nr:hypothetical protein COPEUT_00251 [Coprococcus eutactus ATCC 27759]